MMRKQNVKNALPLVFFAVILSISLIVMSCKDAAGNSGGGILSASVKFVQITLPNGGFEGKDAEAGTDGTDKGVFLKGKKIQLKPYAIAEKEVTYKLWKEVYDWAAKHGYTFANKGHKGSSGSGNEMEPVTKVSWGDCIVWCNAFTEMKNGTTNECVYREKDNPSIVLKNATSDMVHTADHNPDKKGFRLPTEEEWEYAARFQNDKTNAQNYGSVLLTRLNSASGAKKPLPYKSLTLPQNWPELRDEAARVAVYEKWWDGNAWAIQEPATSGTAQVGSKAANALGLYDMSGNVWEWCFDKIDNNSKLERVIRGGSWSDMAKEISVGSRLGNNSMASNIGFRLAASGGGSSAP